jgi:hypothetical protein
MPKTRGAKMEQKIGERADSAKFAKPPAWGGPKNRITQLQVTKAT